MKNQVGKGEHSPLIEDLRQQTIDLIKAWAGEAGKLFRASFPKKKETVPDKTRYSLDRQYLRSETIFLAERNAEAQKAEERKRVCESIAASTFPLSRILSAEDEESLEKMFVEASSIQTIHHNQSISIDYVQNEDFENQSGAARIHLIKFFIIKALCCKIEGKELNYNNRNEFLLSDTKLRLKHLEMEISNLLREGFAICSNNQDQMREFQERILTRALQAEEAVSLPATAPELFTNRKDKAERAPEFIRRVYAPWLGKGLLRPHIKELDKSLYQSLYKHGVPSDFDTLLPKAPGLASKGKGVLSDLEAIEKRRASVRKSAKKAYRGAKL